MKLAAARARIEGGESVVDTMARFKIANRRQVSSWCRLYEEKGAAAFGLEGGSCCEAAGGNR